MTCQHCKEEIHENHGRYVAGSGRYYHVKFWVQVTADHEAEPVSEVSCSRVVGSPPT